MAEKKCRYCSMMIPGDAKICPHCRKSQAAGTTRNIISFLALIFMLYTCSQNPIFDSYKQKAITKNPDMREKVSVEVSKFYKDSGYIRIAGYIKNDNDVPVGVKVKFTCYDSNNEVAKVNESWPASVRNIPAHSKYTFETMFEGYPGIKKLKCEVIDVTQW